MTIPIASQIRNEPATHSVLVVEDEAIIRTTLGEFLSGEGYAVGVAGTVSHALDLSGKRRFDVTICDVQLPLCQPNQTHQQQTEDGNQKAHGD